MRPSRQLYATVKSAAKYLEANTPTGLTGVLTHPSPRPALLYTYTETLKKLQQLPSSSVYRQSAEALTKHRMSIVEATKPAGYDQWLERVKKHIESKEGYGKFKGPAPIITYLEKEQTSAPRRQAWSEGSNTQQEAEQKAAALRAEIEDAVIKETHQDASVQDLEVEPALTADQISELETKIGAGLIEEVIHVAQGELKVIDEMLATRAWENLEEQAPSGQWEYFDRGDRV